MLPPESWVCAGFAVVMLILDMTYSAFIVRSVEAAALQVALWPPCRPCPPAHAAFLQ